MNRKSEHKATRRVEQRRSPARNRTHPDTSVTRRRVERTPGSVVLADATQMMERIKQNASNSQVTRRSYAAREETRRQARQNLMFFGTLAMLFAAVILMVYSILTLSGVLRSGAEQMAELPPYSYYYEYQGDGTSANREAEAVESNYFWVDSSVLDALDEGGKIELIGAIAAEDQQRSGILASVTAAQLILESACLSGTSALAANHNNYFGIKGDPDDSTTWRGSTWDGSTAKYTTAEQGDDGEIYYVDDYFRVYGNLIDSVADHSAYLANATWDGTEEIYPGIEDMTDYHEVAKLIAEHYATDWEYADALVEIIDDYNLTRFDA